MKINGIFILFLLIILLAASLYAEITVTDFHYRDYGYITRAVITTSGKPVYDIEQQPYRFFVEIEGGVRSPSVAERVTLSNSAVSFVRFVDTEEGLRIKVVLMGSYKLEYFYLDGERHRIVLDIYSIAKPQTLEQQESFIRFFTAVGYHSRALPLIKEVLETNPERTGINYYWGVILNRRDRRKEAIEKLNLVEAHQDEFLNTQRELIRMGILNVEVPEGFEELFYEYLQLFERAGSEDINRLMIAFLSSMFAEEQKAKESIMNIPAADQSLTRLLENFRNTMGQLSADGDIKRHFPEIAKALPKRAEAELYVIGFIVFAALLIAVSLISILSMRKKLIDFKNIYVDFQADRIDNTENSIDPSPEEKDFGTESTETDDEPLDEPDSEKTEIISPDLKAENDKDAAQQTGPEGLANISNYKLTKDIALKLFAKGWSVESIAEELQISKENVEKLLT